MGHAFRAAESRDRRLHRPAAGGWGMQCSISTGSRRATSARHRFTSVVYATRGVEITSVTRCGRVLPRKPPREFPHPGLTTSTSLTWRSCAARRTSRGSYLRCMAAGRACQTHSWPKSTLQIGTHRMATGVQSVPSSPSPFSLPPRALFPCTHAQTLHRRGCQRPNSASALTAVFLSRPVRPRGSRRRESHARA